MTRLTAAELNITQPEYDALIWVRDALDPKISDHQLPDWITFDMYNWGSVSGHEDLSCGTNCCIGGSMEMHMAGLTKQPDDYFPTEEEAKDSGNHLRRLTGRSYGSPAFNALFFQFGGVNDDRPAAVKAIDQFLAGNITNPWMV